MSRHSFITRQRGFGLLEVMIAVLVLAVGLLSLGSLHSMIIKSSSSAKAQSNAAALAQEKLDDLTSFQQLPAGANGIFGFNEITSNAGGNENADGTLVLPTGSVTIANVNYNRTWTVQDYYFCTENSAPSTTNSCSASNPNFKLITMSVTWTDSDGRARRVNLQSTVAAISPASSGQSATTGGRQGPTVTYTPGVAPEVIPIGMGDNTIKEATKPTPDITQHGTSTIVTFDEITYNNVLNTKRRDNFFTVNCVCSQNGIPGANGAKGYLPTTFDGDEYVIPTATTSNKRTGSTYRQGQTNEQPAICDICCRDHHDLTAPSSSNPSSFNSVYDPFRPVADYHSSGDHKHYYVNGSGSLVEANNIGDQYFEACRMGLVGGSPWVLQDWKLETHQIMPSNALGSNVSAYTTYVTTYIEQFLRNSALSSTSTTYPLATPDLSSNSSVISAQNNLPSDSTSMSINGTRQYVGRGLYIDYMSPELRKLIRCKIDPSLESGCSNTAAENYLPFVPFHEVNLTRQANWSPTQSTIAKVTNTALTNSNETTFSRGLVTAVGGGTQVITAIIAKSNTGLTGGSNALDPYDLSPTYAISDTDTISVAGSTSPPASTITVSGTISNTSGVNGLASGMAILGTGGASCSLTGNNFPLTYSCTFTSGVSGTISIRGYSKGNSTDTSGGNSNNCLNVPSTTGLTLPPAITFTSGDTFTSTSASNDAETSTFTFASTVNTSLSFTIKADTSSNSGICL